MPRCSGTQHSPAIHRLGRREITQRNTTRHSAARRQPNSAELSTTVSQTQQRVVSKPQQGVVAGSTEPPASVKLNRRQSNSISLSQTQSVSVKLHRFQIQSVSVHQCHSNSICIKLHHLSVKLNRWQSNSIGVSQTPAVLIKLHRVKLHQCQSQSVSNYTSV